MKKCSNCKFYKHRGGIPGVLNPFVDFQGECVIRSPQQQIQFSCPLGTTDPETGEVETFTYTGSFPLRLENDYCAEWEEKDDK